MQALKLPAIRGWQWLAEGYALFRRRPSLVGLMVMTYWLCFILLAMIPPVGSILAPLVMPGLMVGVMTACRNLDQDLPTPFSLFFQSLRDNFKSLAMLGIMQVGCSLGVVALSSLVDGGVLVQLLSGKTLEKEVVENSNLVWALWFVVALLTPLMMAYWYAPMLVVWHRISIFKALFFSLFACLRNWKAFLVYFLSFVGVVGILPALVADIGAAVLPGMAGVIKSVVVMFLLMVVSPSIVASFYISYRDVFVVREHISEHV